MAAWCAAIVGLAREFNQTTIAEGVEDEATLLLLREMGVDLAQGYLFGRPAPLADAPAGSGREPRPASRGGEDPIAIVTEAFDAFARRDVPGMLAHCRPDFVLRSLATSRAIDRTEPYRGHDGVRAYVRDVATVWEELTMTLMTVRRAGDSVMGFGRVEARRPGERMLASVMWVCACATGRSPRSRSSRRPAKRN